jgi:FMN phosphatase YigB (HAD superfamily)
MIIKKEIIERIEKDFTKASPFFGVIHAKIEKKISLLPETEALFMKYMYAYMPLSDVGEYDFEIFYGYAKHALFLADNSPFAKQISQEDFLNYVLSYRINNEDITDCRRFFYDLVMDRIKGLSMSEAVLELNNWCYEQATYRSTSIRTASPVTVYKGGFGRCGEESTFFVTILRSVGIPARQIYVPRWSHSDSNHAWVETWCDGKWYFTGACEPKPILNSGWFTYAASRAVIAESRVFTEFGYDEMDVTEKHGTFTLLNTSDMYLQAKYFTVYVNDTEGKPVKDAMVRIEIVNSSELYPVVTLISDDNGMARVKLGKGDIHLHVIKDGLLNMQVIDLREIDEINVVLDPNNKVQYDVWKDYRIMVPESAQVNGVDMTPEQEKEQEERNKQGDVLREERINGYYDSEYTKQFEAYPAIIKALDNARGNFACLRTFLDCYYEGVTLEDKEALLKYIERKDHRDIEVKVLEDQLDAIQYKNDYPKEIFEQYVLSPRIYFEMSSPFRSFIKEYFKDKDPELVKNPKQLWEYINKEIKHYPDKEYSTLIATPKSALALKTGSPMAKRVLFVAICRTFGLAARLDEENNEPQYLENDIFVFVEEIKRKKAELTLISEDDQNPIYYQQFTIGRKEPNGTYRTIELEDMEWSGGRITLELIPGEYRVITCDRMKSGSVVGKQLFLQLIEAEHKTYQMKCNVLTAEDLQQVSTLPEFTLRNQEGQTISSHYLLGEDKNILIFTEAGKEPTEHVFNEMLEITKMSGEPACGLHFVIRDEKELSDETFQKIQKSFPSARYWYDDYTETVKTLSAATNVDANKLPLVLVTDGSTRSLYACSGYNVGCVDILMRLLK